MIAEYINPDTKDTRKIEMKNSPKTKIEEMSRIKTMIKEGKLR
jgi:hypothetical protein